MGWLWSLEMAQGVSRTFSFLFFTVSFILSGCVGVTTKRSTLVWVERLVFTLPHPWEIGFYGTAMSVGCLDEDGVAIPRDITDEERGGNLWERGRGPTDLSVSASVHRRDDAIYDTVRQQLVPTLVSSCRWGSLPRPLHDLAVIAPLLSPPAPQPLMTATHHKASCIEYYHRARRGQERWRYCVWYCWCCKGRLWQGEALPIHREEKRQGGGFTNGPSVTARYLSRNRYIRSRTDEK